MIAGRCDARPVTPACRATQRVPPYEAANDRENHRNEDPYRGSGQDHGCSAHRIQGPAVECKMRIESAERFGV